MSPSCRAHFYNIQVPLNRSVGGLKNAKIYCNCIHIAINQFLAFAKSHSCGRLMWVLRAARSVVLRDKLVSGIKAYEF